MFGGWGVADEGINIDATMSRQQNTFARPKQGARHLCSQYVFFFFKHANGADSARNIHKVGSRCGERE